MLKINLELQLFGEVIAKILEIYTNKDNYNFEHFATEIFESVVLVSTYNKLLELKGDSTDEYYIEFDDDTLNKIYELQFRFIRNCNEINTGGWNMLNIDPKIYADSKNPLRYISLVFLDADNQTSLYEFNLAELIETEVYARPKLRA